MYAPAQTTEKKQFWEEKLPKLMNQVKIRCSPKDRIVVGMDANITMEPDLDTEWQGGTRIEVEKAAWIHEWTNSYFLRDTWRQKHPKDREYTRLAQLESKQRPPSTR